MCAHPGFSQTEARSVPGSLSIATRMDKECLFSESLKRPRSLLDRPIAVLKLEPAVEKAAGPELAAALAVKLIDFGVSKLDTYIDNAAKDRVASYTRRHPISLHQIEKVDSDFEIRLNPKIGCLTIVAHTSPIFYTGKSHPQSGNAQLPSFKKLLRGGFQFDPTSSPSIIFETALVVSQEGTAARLIPTFLKVVSFDDGKGNAVGKAERRIALTYNLEKVSGTATVFRDTIDLGMLSVKDALFSINGSDRRNYYDQTLLAAHLPRPAWKTYSHIDFELDPKKNPIVGAITSGLLTDASISSTPANFTVDITITEEASEVAKFLSDFAQEQELTSVLRERLIDDLGLRSEEEIKEALKSEYTDRKMLVTTYRDAYIFRYSKDDEKPESYEDNLKKYEAELQRLDLLLLESQGIDPLGIFTSSD
jgi:hypothetical protein